MIPFQIEQQRVWTQEYRYNKEQIYLEADLERQKWKLAPEGWSPSISP